MVTLLGVLLFNSGASALICLCGYAAIKQESLWRGPKIWCMTSIMFASIAYDSRCICLNDTIIYLSWCRPSWYLPPITRNSDFQSALLPGSRLNHWHGAFIYLIYWAGEIVNDECEANLEGKSKRFSKRCGSCCKSIWLEKRLWHVACAWHENCVVSWPLPNQHPYPF